MSEQTDQKMVAKLATKLSELGQKIGALQRDGKNSFSNYQYISNEQLVTALRREAQGCKVNIIPAVESVQERDFQNEKGKMVIRSCVTMSFRVIDMETGYSESFKFSGAEQDTGGKSLQQAITQCTKYFYFKLFDVTSHEEVDSDQKTEEAAAPKAEDTRQWLNKGTKEWTAAVNYLATDPDASVTKIMAKYKVSKADQQILQDEAMGLIGKEVEL